MSWGEVYKINSNMKKPLNEQIQSIKCLPIRLITASTTFTPEKTGVYKVICVGAGGAGYAYKTTNSGNTVFSSGGGSGGVAVKVLTLNSGTKYNVSIGTSASFGNIMTTTGGTAGNYYIQDGAIYSTGGTATGGDYNFAGAAGESGYATSGTFKGASVNVWFTELTPMPTTIDGLTTGDGVLRYGGGGSASRTAYNSVNSDVAGQPAAVIIIPLEMEE